MIFLGLALYDPESPAALHRLLLPALLAAGAWALVQNVAVVAIATAVLGVIHLDSEAGGWIDRFAYPAITAAALLTLAAIGVQRFRRRIVETREARWSERGK